MYFLSTFFHEKGNDDPRKGLCMSGNLSRFCFQNMRNCFSISVPFPRKMCCFCTLNPRKMCKNSRIIPRKMCKFAEKNSLEWNEKPFSY